jgi:hypothetical protein
MTPIRLRSNKRLNMVLQNDDPLGISFYGSDTTMSMYIGSPKSCPAGLAACQTM